MSGFCSTQRLQTLVLFLMFTSRSTSTEQSQTSCYCQDGISRVPGKSEDQRSVRNEGRDEINEETGLPGRDGETGRGKDQGPVGYEGKRGPQVLESTTSNWKECMWKSHDEKDTGKIMDCLFVKKSSSTALRVHYGGTVRTNNYDQYCKRWYFTFNGAECSAPMAIDGVFHMKKGVKQKLILHHRHIQGHCLNIPKGDVRVGFWVGNCPGTTNLSSGTRDDSNEDINSGWNYVSSIFVEEVPQPQK